MCAIWFVLISVFGVFDPFPTAAAVVKQAVAAADSANTIDAPGGEGCYATDGGTCRYRARSAGGVEAAGSSWWVDIFRGTHHIHIGPGAYGDPADLEGDTVVLPDVIRPGDRVFASTGGTSASWAGFVHVGPTKANR